jgi:energy-coupling factor transporter ATP-binding protein EcfA2
MLELRPELHTPSDTVASDRDSLSSPIAKQLAVLRRSLQRNLGVWVVWAGEPKVIAGVLTESGNPNPALLALDGLDNWLHPRRGLWRALTDFHTSTTPDTLAELLAIAAANFADFEALREAEWAHPWQLRCILAAVERPEELAPIEALVSSGTLGSAADWLAAERRWTEMASLSTEDLRPWIETDAPWNHDIGERGIPWPELRQWGSATDHPELRRAFQLALIQPSSRLWKAAHLAQRLLALDSNQPLVAFPIAASAEACQEPRRMHSLRAIASLLPDLGGPHADQWYELLDHRGKRSSEPVTVWRDDRPARCRRLSEIIVQLVQRVSVQPDQWGLIDTIGAALFGAPTADLSDLDWGRLPEGMPAQALGGRAQLQLLAGPIEAAKRGELLSLLGDPSGTYDYRGGLTQIVPLRRGLPDRESLLLGALEAEPPPSEDVRDALLGALQEVRLQEQRPAFDSVAAWAAAGLPEPFLPLPKAGGAVVLHAIRRLKNIRAFADTPAVSRPFPIPRADEGQWILLIGENGVGKTTLLRALALALAEPAVGTKLIDERTPLLRNGGEGEVEVLVGEGPFGVRVRRTGRAEEVVSEAEPEAGPERPWVVAYGVRRGDARGEFDQGAPEAGPVGELHTLFDRRASLHRASAWLFTAEANAGREARRGPGSSGKHAAVWAAAKKALVKLLELSDLFVDEDGVVRVDHPTFGTLRLDALSDGYLTTAGWVIDMLARWVIRQDELDAPFGADLLSEMRGLVLIDEIDLHLHPLWQLRAVEDLRALFPRLSFIATTHNPLCLQGARAGEIYRMRRVGTELRLEQEDITPGDDVDRILLDQFGVPHTEDPGTRLLLARHRQLLREGKADDAERRSIERELAERLGGPPPALGGGGRRLGVEERPLLTPFLKRR